MMTTISFEVPNISCGHCVHTIQTEVAELEGVARVTASAGTRTVEIEFQPPATEDGIRALLKEINYAPA